MGHRWDYLNEYRGKDFQGEWPTIAEMFLLTAKRFPHNKCFTRFNPDRETWDFTEVKGHVARIASWLIEQGLKPGDRVALNGKNSPFWGLTYVAVCYAGGVIVPIDNQMHIERLMELAAFAGVSFFFADSDVLEKLDKENEWVKTLQGKTVTLLGVADAHSPFIMDLKPEKEYPLVPRTEDDVAALLFTSGTTGNEKAVELTNKNLISDVYQAGDMMPFVDDTDTLYALLPLHHTYCCTAVFLECLEHGAECLFGQSLAVSRMLNDLKRGHVTVFMGIPLLFNKVLAGMMKEVKKKGPVVNGMVHLMMIIGGQCKLWFGKNPMRPIFNKLLLSKIGLDHNRLCISGAGPLAPKVFKQYQQLGVDFVQGYGLTETSPIVTLNPVDHFKIDSIGKVFPLDEVIIAEPNEHGVGEIRVKGPNVCRGYYHDEAHTKELFDENGYLRTGDLGTMDDEHYVYLKGRAKNIIVTEGGKNVYPEEIEDMFQLYDEIRQIMIRGYQEKKDVPSECIEAVVYPDPELKDKEKRINQIIGEVNAKLAGYKKISKVTILDKPMETTTTMKVKRSKVK